MNYNNLNSMVNWERQKAMFLVQQAESLGMDVDGYGELAVNPNSGYTYLWLEDYNFTLYMPITCELVKNDIWALYSCPIDGEEIETDLEDHPTLKELEIWADEQSKFSDRKDQ